jgi:hypothetical protein
MYEFAQALFNNREVTAVAEFIAKGIESDVSPHHHHFRSIGEVLEKSFGLLITDDFVEKLFNSVGF